MISFLKKKYHYFILFIFIFLEFYLFRNVNSFGDAINNYGFSYAISIGEVPYLDFNTVSTPLFAFVMAIGFLFSKSYIMFLLEQTILVTIMFILLNKMYGEKCYILLIIMCFFKYLAIMPTYNFFLLFLIVLLLFLETKHSDKDFLIGLVIGLTIITKHTVGCFLIIPSIIFFYKQKGKIIKRLFGLLIPCIILFLYLMITKSFSAFLDLCIFGLFDFSKSNSQFFSIDFFISLILLLISIFVTLKNRKNIVNYYILSSFSILIPLFDDCHISIIIVLLFLQLIGCYNKNDNIFLLCIMIAFIFESAQFLFFNDTLPVVLNKKIDPFKNWVMLEGLYNEYKNDYSIYDKNKDAYIITYSYYRIPYDVARNKRIDYFDIVLNGNYGYNGTKKMIKRINRMDNTYFLIDMTYYNDDNEKRQINKEVMNYIIDNSTLIKKYDIYNLYYYEG